MDWCFWPVVLEKTLESPLGCKETKPVNPKLNQSWIFIGRTDAEAETPILWTPDAKNWLIWKDSDSGTDWRQKENGTTEDEMVGWHHWLDGHELQQAPGVGDGQGVLMWCSPWGCKESDTIEQLNWSESMETNSMNINRWMDKEDGVHVFNGILLSHKNKQRWIVYRDVDKPRVCHTEWSRLKREI